MPMSCHFRDCKALLVTSLTHVSGAIASVQTIYLFTSHKEATKSCPIAMPLKYTVTMQIKLALLQILNFNL